MPRRFVQDNLLVIDWLKNHGVSFEFVKLLAHPDPLRWTERFDQQARHYQIRFMRWSHPHHELDGRSWSRTPAFCTFYSMGSGLTGSPLAIDVMSSLLRDMDCSEAPFPEWCDEFGYDPDSMRAHHIWELCRSEAEQMRKFFTPDELIELGQIPEIKDR